MAGTTETSKHRTSNPTKSRARPLWVVGISAVVVAVAAVAFMSSGSDLEAAPDVALPNFEGETVRISDFEGRPLVVNYWASWCLPCLAELPGFEEVYQARKASIGFLGINLADDPARALTVAADTGITYPLAIDAVGSSFGKFGGLAMPTTVFIDDDGYVMEVFSGDLLAEQLEAKIQQHFGG